jgi:hypothetical protein
VLSQLGQCRPHCAIEVTESAVLGDEAVSVRLEHGGPDEGALDFNDMRLRHDGLPDARDGLARTPEGRRGRLIARGRKMDSADPQKAGCNTLAQQHGIPTLLVIVLLLLWQIILCS